MQALGNMAARPVALRFGRRDHSQPAHSGDEPASGPPALTISPSTLPPSTLPPSPPPYPPDEPPGTNQGVPLNFFYQHPDTGEFHHSHGLVALLELARAGERPMPMDATPSESSEYEEGELPDSPDTAVTSRPIPSRPVPSSMEPDAGFSLPFIPLSRRRTAHSNPERPAVDGDQSTGVPSSSPTGGGAASGQDAGYPPAFYELA
ncbi:hypothetical protein [Vampirovibrio chlorellavorus]|uniref:hypothetical protein n=1 Tax=Vampirovibrio chlorellavorus TaxID=758823 RepID=UPI0026EA93E7|nr:hypothetical protein [Vampirovibrio chlorellavorus]